MNDQARAITPEERAAIIDVYNAYAEGIDRKNWPLVRACFADEVLLDYGDLSNAGGDGDAPQRADDWIRSLQSVANGFDLTRHTITNHRFKRVAQGIECRAYLTADHIIYSDIQGGDPRQDLLTLVGEYRNTFVPAPQGWQVVQSQLTSEYTVGPDDLFARAMERAASL